MEADAPPNGRILRLFQVRTKTGCAQKLIEKFAVTSAEVVRGEPGNEGYFFGYGIESDKDYVVFASVWRDLEVIKARFGEAWRDSFLPEGYEDLIEDCSIRHVDLGAGWHVDIEPQL